MQIILLEKVVNLGQLGDVVRVRDGYARNFLIPQGKARRATQAAVAEFEARRAELERLQAEKLAAAQAEGDPPRQARLHEFEGWPDPAEGSVSTDQIGHVLYLVVIHVEKWSCPRAASGRDWPLASTRRSIALPATILPIMRASGQHCKMVSVCTVGAVNSSS